MSKIRGRRGEPASGARRADLQCAGVIRDRSGGVKKFCADVGERLRGFLRDARDCCVKDRICVGGWSGAELCDVDVFDLDIGFQALAVDGLAGRREIARVREPEAAVLGKLHQLLDAGAAERVLAHEVRALVAVERGGEDLGRAGRARRDEHLHGQIDGAVTGLRRNRLPARGLRGWNLCRVGALGLRVFCLLVFCLWFAAALQGKGARFDEQTRRRDAVFEGPFRGMPKVDDQRCRARAREIGHLLFQLFDHAVAEARDEDVAGLRRHRTPGHDRARTASRERAALRAARPRCRE